jgi:hypothetical protein
MVVSLEASLISRPGIKQSQSSIHGTLDRHFFRGFKMKVLLNDVQGEL